MKIYVPKLSQEWNYPTEDGVGMDYVFYNKNNGYNLKDENYYFFLGKLPMPTTKFLIQTLRVALLSLRKELYYEIQKKTWMQLNLKKLFRIC